MSNFIDQLKKEISAVIAPNATPENQPDDDGKTKTAIYHPIRRVPKGTSVSTHNKREAVISLPAAIKTWWYLPYALALPALLIAIGLGLFNGVVAGKQYTDQYGRYQYQEGYFTYAPTILYIILALGMLFLVYQWVNPTLIIRITPEAIQIGKYNFSREHTHGFRMGYEITYSSENKSAFADTQRAFTGLRMQYGRWGEDLPYMINKYHGAEYVIWLNEIIDSVGVPEPSEHAPEQGRKYEEF